MIDVNFTKEEFLIKNDIKDGTIILDDWDVYKFAIIGITDDKQHIIYSHDKIIECLAKEMQKEYFKNNKEDLPYSEFEIDASYCANRDIFNPIRNMDRNFKPYFCMEY